MSNEDRIPLLRLGHVLEERSRAEGGDLPLARKIHEAYCAVYGKARSGAKYVLDRRKIKRLIEWTEIAKVRGARRRKSGKTEPTLVLSLEELLALDAYLERYNEGLAYRPLFARQSILQALAKSGDVIYLLGAKPHETWVDLSNWDVTSMGDLQRAVNKIASSLRFDFQTVTLHDRVELARDSMKEPWTKCLQDYGPSIVAIGSPRACHGTETMLAQMFGRQEFVAPADGDPDLPFCFHWPRLPDSDVPSAFGRWTQGKWLLQVGAEMLAASGPELSRGTTYAVVAAQRRRSGRVWMVIAGLTGSATYAAAQAVESIQADLPQAELGELSPIVWAVVEAVVELDRSAGSRGMRKLVSQRILGEVRRWPLAG